jgi:hypothetical protein
MTTHRSHLRPATRSRRLSVSLAALVVAAAGLLSACGGSSSTAPSASASSNATSGQVLPVTSNPIKNTATATPLAIDSVLVENNVDASGNPADDHLEVALSNSGASDLANLEVYYTFSDPKTGDTESYYLALPSDFTIPAGGQRVAHFDNTGAPDHFPVNEFSLYSTDTNALDVTVIVSAEGAAPQTATVQKDAGGAETAD